MTTEPETAGADASRTADDRAVADRAAGDDLTAEERRPPKRWESIRHRIVTPPAIYGTLLVSAIIGTAEDGETDLEILRTTVPTLLVFWTAHVFAEAIAHYGKHGRDRITMREAVKFSIGFSSGLLYAGIIPCGLLLVGAIGLLEEEVAYSFSLLVPVILLGALGWSAIGDRGGAWPAKLLAGFLTGLLGLVVILLKIVFH
ncbi:hypothetical protein B7R21_13775 [Subtercola boreus]|uniref:Uncharacterized protein n=1 Tax=Subtercola boreus TaxID=120213 RepID=A0A3E0VBQ9_9MICO|nr:hypothetical protein [Subtercola boreus]RFA07284.1 hypothetical protein B7R21_13775 [Subtercola boreus]